MAVRGQSGNAAEDQGKHQGGQQRLDDKPEGAENRLLVHGDKVAPDKQPEQVAVTPDIQQGDVPPACFGGDLHRPGLVGVG